MRASWHGLVSTSSSRASRAARCFSRCRPRVRPYDITDGGWTMDYVDPADFLVPLATASGIKAIAELETRLLQGSVDRASLRGRGAPPRRTAHRSVRRDRVAATHTTRAVRRARLRHSAVHVRNAHGLRAGQPGLWTRPRGSLRQEGLSLRRTTLGAGRPAPSRSQRPTATRACALASAAPSRATGRSGSRRGSACGRPRRPRASA